MVQELWAVDLNLSYSDSAAMNQLLQFVSCGTLDVMTHFFDVPPPKVEEKKLRRRRLKEEEAVSGLAGDNYNKLAEFNQI